MQALLARALASSPHGAGVGAPPMLDALGAWLASGVARGAGMARVPLSKAQRRAAVLPSTLRLNAKYYIEKLALPALERVIGLAGADVRRW